MHAQNLIIRKNFFESYCTLLGLAEHISTCCRPDQIIPPHRGALSSIGPLCGSFGQFRERGLIFYIPTDFWLTWIIKNPQLNFLIFEPLVAFWDSMVCIKMIKLLSFNLERWSFVWKANFDHHADICSQFYKKMKR